MTENNESQKPEEKAIIVKAPIESNSKGLVFRSLDDIYRFGQYLVTCQLAKTPAEALIKIQTGAELGISAMRALQSVMVVNGQARIWGDTPLALVRRSGLMEYIKEYIEGEIGLDLTKTPDTVKGICITKRKGEEEKQTEFSVADAKRAGLWGKTGTWKTHPQRMLIYKTRAFNLRDNYPEPLSGIFIAEEYEGIEMGEAPLNDKPRSAVLLEQPEQPKVDIEIPEITPTEPVVPQTPPTITNSTKVKQKKAKKTPKQLTKEEVEKNAEEMLREYEFKCNDCEIMFDEPGGQGEIHLCPECLSSNITEFKKNET